MSELEAEKFLDKLEDFIIRTIKLEGSGGMCWETEWHELKHLLVQESE